MSVTFDNSLPSVPPDTAQHDFSYANDDDDDIEEGPLDKAWKQSLLVDINDRLADIEEDEKRAQEQGGPEVEYVSDQGSSDRKGLKKGNAITNLISNLYNTKEEEKDEDKKGTTTTTTSRSPAKLSFQDNKPAAARGLKNVKKPVTRKITTRKKPSPVKPKPKPDPKKEREKNIMIAKYSLYVKEFGMADETQTKTTRQLTKMDVNAVRMCLEELKLSINHGFHEEIVADIFESVLKTFAKFYEKKGREFAVLRQLYGVADAKHAGIVLEEKLSDDPERGDVALQVAIKEAAIECSQYLNLPWYAKLTWGMHKIMSEAGDRRLENLTDAEIMSDSVAVNSIMNYRRSNDGG